MNLQDLVRTHFIWVSSLSFVSIQASKDESEHSQLAFKVLHICVVYSQCESHFNFASCDESFSLESLRIDFRKL